MSDIHIKSDVFDVTPNNYLKYSTTNRIKILCVRFSCLNEVNDLKTFKLICKNANMTRHETANLLCHNFINEDLIQRIKSKIPISISKIIIIGEDDVKNGRLNPKVLHASASSIHKGYNIVVKEFEELVEVLNNINKQIAYEFIYKHISMLFIIIDVSITNFMVENAIIDMEYMRITESRIWTKYLIRHDLTQSETLYKAKKDDKLIAQQSKNICDEPLPFYF